MAKKTVLIDVLKFAPKSVEMAKALDLDYKSEAKEEKLNNFSYVDTDPIQTTEYENADIVNENVVQEDMFEGTPYGES